MHYHEVNVFGVYIAPIVPMMAVAWVLVWPLQRLGAHFGVERLVWHPALFDVALYAIVLFTLILIVGVV